MSEVLSIKKGSKTDVLNLNKDKESPLRHITVGLGWDARVTDGEKFDLDASAILLDENKKVRAVSDFVFYGNPEHASGSVRSTGDNRTGEGDGDDETILVDLDKVPDYVMRILFIISIDEAKQRNQNFGQVENSYVRLFDSELPDGNIMRYDLEEEYSTERSLEAGALYRKDVNSPWKFDAMGAGYEDGLDAILSRYGIQASY